MYGILEIFKSMNVEWYIKFSVMYVSVLVYTIQVKRIKKTSLKSVSDIITFIYYNNTRLQCETILDTCT